MPPKNTPTAPWQELEKQAYHAWREWHIWLALRERELSERAARPDQREPDPMKEEETR